jgi:dimethylargininase
MFTRAIVRPPAPNFADGLTTVDLGKPDAALALAQFEGYCRALEDCGLALTRLPADPRFPDSTFVEDTAVLPERRGAAAVLTRPGAESRAGEVSAIEGALAKVFPSLRRIEAPGTVDGGDICEAGDRFFIGVSRRTNEDGARQLARFLEADGYATTLVDIRANDEILHLKSGIAWLGDEKPGNGTLVVIGSLASDPAFQGRDVLRVPKGEEYAANCILVNDRILVAEGFPRFERALRERGHRLAPLPMSEFQKMDGGLSCLSLRF